MSESRVEFDLRNPQQAYADILRMWQWAKAHLIAGHWLVLVVRLATRSDAQNRLLHSRLNDVAKCCDWAGAKRDVDTWRRLFISAWLRVHGQQVEILPALDGHGVDIVYASSTKLTRAECADLSEYIMAWGSEREVPWCAASLAMDVPPTVSRKAAARANETIDEITGEIATTAAMAA